MYSVSSDGITITVYILLIVVTIMYRLMSDFYILLTVTVDLADC